jgi:transposase InsO family protein
MTVQQLITDNGSAYRSTVHAIACRTLAIRHLRTRPYRPQTNGKNRALHPHHARLLGLRRDLPRQHRTHRRARRLA